MAETSTNLHQLPPNLPAPADDGACDHLPGSRVPSIRLASTGGGVVDLAEAGQRPAVFFFYPRTGEPGKAAGPEWDAIPGARGCTPQSCGFRDLHREFTKLGVAVFGVSTQETDYQREFVARNHVPFELLSDRDLLLTRALRLPTFEYPVERGEYRARRTDHLDQAHGVVRRARIDRADLVPGLPAGPECRDGARVAPRARARARARARRGQARMKIGVLALQGDFSLHRKSLDRIGVESVEVRMPRQLEDVGGLIMPGGESTTLLKLMDAWDFVPALEKFHAAGRPIFGTCAGMILLAREVQSPAQFSLGFIDLTVERNAYGRQKESFEAVGSADLGAGPRPLKMVFIRAPRIRRLGPASPRWPSIGRNASWPGRGAWSWPPSTPS